MARALSGFAKEANMPPGVKGEKRLCGWEGCKVEILPVTYKADGTPIYLGRYCDTHIQAMKDKAKAEEAEAAKARAVEALKREWKTAWGGEESHYHLTKREDLPNQAAAKKLLEASKSESLYVHGPTGHGKTRTIYLHALEWLREEWECPLIKRAIELRHEIATAARKDENARERLMNRLKFARLLILDDVGHMASTPAGQEAFLELVEFRDALRKPIWLTSQLTLEELADTFTGHTGQAIVRRLGQMCRLIDFTPGAAN